MNTPEDIQLKSSEVDFFYLAKREPNPRTRIRLLALGHLKAGKSKQEVTEMFRIVLITLRRWVLRFAAKGVPGLKEQPGKGRKRKLAEEQEEAFRQQVEKLQTLREGGRVRGQDIQVLLKEKFCVDHALPSVYHVLERCGLSWISARSKHPKSDPLIQEDFKKNFKKK
ncbi:MAG: winged helix-turn-helix domain-containing protein [Chlamydiia bacterium]|nr:winged helix-turn-helix domain-containing protein [Chlamydiia bacterium]MCP5505403.1 winged helix-turn-helix domain-containing protein [Chlamydiales bacterium]MCP5505789.1 winged helix-turn-helix domain-containing protein [Chlamydiales bacterium]MCP5506044.1 winged helix-turn-helix domain-containing protein [Chlamydiales bacterium]MCP5506164.1 winged helix-turn-helix domain-containing protein [Chlamydiales bacterium]